MVRVLLFEALVQPRGTCSGLQEIDVESGELCAGLLLPVFLFLTSSTEKQAQYELLS